MIYNLLNYECNNCRKLCNSLLSKDSPTHSILNYFQSIHTQGMGCQKMKGNDGDTHDTLEVKRCTSSTVSAQLCLMFRYYFSLKNLIDRGDAMPCPGCDTILSKQQGCDWIKCSVCNMEICWATKGPRWGPKVSSNVRIRLFYRERILRVLDAD